MIDRAVERVGDSYQRTFGAAAHWLSSAPGRVNLIGEFTDFNGGFVLPMAIEQRTAIAAAPNPSRCVVLQSEAAGETHVIDLDRPLERLANGCWANYPRGVLAEFLQLGFKMQGFNAVISSDIPMGAGLSSSAAFETAFGLILERICESSVDRLQLALLCQRAEHTYALVPCGIMDQYICLMGRLDHVLLLDCRSNTPAWISWTDPEVNVLVVNTGVKHKLSSSEYAIRRHACEEVARVLGVASLREADLSRVMEKASQVDEISVRCARHVIAENERTRYAADCIRNHDWIGFGTLMYESHTSLRQDYRVSCQELDLIVDFAASIGPVGGVFGARMTGGGFGGCAIVLVQTAAQERVRKLIAREYDRLFGFEPSIYISRPSVGATVHELSHA